MILADVSSLIASQKAHIIDVWRVEGREIFGTQIERSLLDDKLEDLLQTLVETLSGEGSPQLMEMRETLRSKEHGTTRAEQGFDVVQMTREFHALRNAIETVCQEAGQPLDHAARDILDKVIDTATTVALERFGVRHGEMAKEREARQMSYIVHDFRVPLGAVALAAAEIAASLPPELRTPEMMENLALLGRNVQNLSLEMEKAMREFADSLAGASRLRMGRIRLNDVVADVLERFQLSARKAQTLLLNRVSLELEVEASADALHRILANLVGNALRYTPGGEVSVTSTQKGEEVEIAVQDTGMGIVAERLKRIFEPGEKDISSPGMGFGLAITKHLVELQGGRVRIESTLGKGTTVTFTLRKAARPLK